MIVFDQTFDLQDILETYRTKTEKMKFLSGHVGTLSTPSKMPGFAYSLPAKDCITGSKLREVKNSVCSACYALKGRYMFPNVITAMDKRLQAVLNNPFWHVYMKELIELQTKELYFRWHDSGDLQSAFHLTQIKWIAWALPDIQFWLPTRENRIVSQCAVDTPDNLCIRVSNHLIDSYSSAKNFDNVSAVISDEAKLLNGIVCHATRKESDKTCGSCRACWDKDIRTINYLKH